MLHVVDVVVGVLALVITFTLADFITWSLYYYLMILALVRLAFYYASLV
jgi:hypothetical protein